MSTLRVVKKHDANGEPYLALVGENNEIVMYGEIYDSEENAERAAKMIDGATIVYGDSEQASADPSEPPAQEQASLDGMDTGGSEPA